MKKQFFLVKIFLLSWIVSTTVSSYAQQKITVTATSPGGNIMCNNTCVVLDVPDLNGNPNAIIISVTPVLVNSVNQNPWTISVGYNRNNDNKWSFINMGNQNIKNGAKFNIAYYPQPDNNQFVDVVTNYQFVQDGSVIDHAGLNDNPDAEFQFIQNVTPGIGSFYNLADVEINYVASKGRWCIFNKNNTKVPTGTKYNIALTPGPAAIKNLGGKDSSLTVQGFKNVSTSIIPPRIGQVLKWNGTEWAPANDSTCCPVNKNNNSNGDPEWLVNGNNLYNTKGNVGIGMINPNSPLGFAATLGKKISLYPGATGDVGFGVAPNRLQIFSDNPNADVAIGYDNAGTFNERFAVKGNGALAVNGNTGTTGQILQSNGPGTAATWNKKPYVLNFFTSITSFIPVFTKDNKVVSMDIQGIAGSTFTLDQNSNIVVSLSCNLFALCDCDVSNGFIDIDIKCLDPFNEIFFKTFYNIRNGETVTLSNNLSFQLPAGNYIIYATINRRDNQQSEIQHDSGSTKR